MLLRWLCSPLVECSSAVSSLSSHGRCTEKYTKPRAVFTFIQAKLKKHERDGSRGPHRGVRRRPPGAVVVGRAPPASAAASAGSGRRLLGLAHRRRRRILLRVLDGRPPRPGLPHHNAHQRQTVSTVARSFWVINVFYVQYRSVTSTFSDLAHAKMDPQKRSKRMEPPEAAARSWFSSSWWDRT